jgi:hypothetical protein
LAEIQVGIEAILGQEFLVAAFFNHPAIHYNQDDVSIADGRQSVGDNQAVFP